MEKVQIVSIYGNKAKDQFGRDLRVISNTSVRPGCYVYTDGVVIYGWDFNHTEPAIAPFAKKGLSLPLYNTGAPDINWTSKLDYLFRAQYMTPDEKFPKPCFDAIDDGLAAYSTNWWYERPPFFNDSRDFYSLRGTFDNPVLYSSKGDSYPVGRMLYLGITDDHGIVWQDGNENQTLDTIKARVYKMVDSETEEIPGSPSITQTTYSVIDKTFAQYLVDRPYDIGSGCIYCPSYSLVGRDLSDLSIVFETDGHVQRVNASRTIGEILEEIKTYADTLADESIPANVPHVPYPDDRPPSVLVGWCLSSDLDVEGYHWYSPGYLPNNPGVTETVIAGRAGFMYGFGGQASDNSFYGIVPLCDNLTAYGGNPLDTVDFRRYTGYENGVYPYYPGTSSSGLIPGNWRVPHMRTIKNVRFDGGHIEYDVALHVAVMYHPYKERIDPPSGRRTVYVPPVPSGGAYIWDSKLIYFSGWYRVREPISGITGTWELLRRTIWKQNRYGDWAYCDDQVLKEKFTDTLKDGFSVTYTYIDDSGDDNGIVAEVYKNDDKLLTINGWFYGIGDTAPRVVTADPAVVNIPWTFPAVSVAALDKHTVIVTVPNAVFVLRDKKLVWYTSYLQRFDSDYYEMPMPFGFTRRGGIANNEFIPNKNMGKLDALYKRLKNVPYYE